MIFDVLAYYPIVEHQRGVHGILGGGRECGRHLLLPASIHAGWIGRRRAATCGGVFANRLVQARLRSHSIDLAQQVFDHIGVVNADIDQHAALVFLMPPDRDQHVIAAVDRVVDQ
jgi:hypothetical protein